MRVSVLLLVVSFFSLSVSGQSEDIAPRIIVSDKAHVVTYEMREGNVVFTLESIADFTDDTAPIDAGFWKKDFASISIDTNANGLVDERIDRAFGLRNGTTEICPQFLYNARASSACCRALSKADVTVSFRGTANEANPHPVFEFTIPRSDLGIGTERPGVVFRFHSAGRGYATYPEKPKGEPYTSFKNTYLLEF